MLPKAARFPFDDLHSSKNYVGFVKLCAPDQSPTREGFAADEQWTLELALAGLHHGLHLAAANGVEPQILSKCQELYGVAF